MRKLQNSCARSYCFGPAIAVFHALAARRTICGHGGPRGNAALQGKPQLTCRTGAPKTRHHSGRLAPKHGIQGEKKWAMYSFATP
jgi:hypothetical protein